MESFRGFWLVFLIFSIQSIGFAQETPPADAKKTSTREADRKFVKKQLDLLLQKAKSLTGGRTPIEKFDDIRAEMIEIARGVDGAIGKGDDFAIDPIFRLSEFGIWPKTLRPGSPNSTFFQVMTKIGTPKSIKLAEYERRKLGGGKFEIQYSNGGSLFGTGEKESKEDCKTEAPGKKQVDPLFEFWDRSPYSFYSDESVVDPKTGFIVYEPRPIYWGWQYDSPEEDKPERPLPSLEEMKKNKIPSYRILCRKEGKKVVLSSGEKALNESGKSEKSAKNTKGKKARY